MDLPTKTVLITGAGSGIGAAVAENLAKKAFNIIVSDLNLSSAEKVSAKINAHGGHARALGLDVADQQSIESCAATHPEIDILVNNAGLQFVAKLESFPPEKWRLLMDVLLVGPAMLSRALLPAMRERGYGRIINVGSIHALVASPFKSAYVAAKHGLLGFSKVVALETADQNITINTICPSYVKTPLVESQITQQAREHGMSEADVIDKIMLEPMPKKAFIGMDELVAATTFLISDEARNMTGQTLTIDGGWTIK
ncbi:3-hydroxybutyrate dehydrogenase [Teredinibacter turnerae]|uniref:3-hydroxybutyrate dehydrogenase n=1 Tax=Teredinibacter turnerae TaxID=2426 RepID=UPI000374D196|nr:3-hydroxybutyrate dehydrogenase [Teredinibacter turnerae]